MIYAVQIHDAFKDKYQVMSSDDLFSAIKEVIKELESVSVYEVHLVIIKEEGD